VLGRERVDHPGTAALVFEPMSELEICTTLSFRKSCLVS